LKWHKVLPVGIAQRRRVRFRSVISSAWAKCLICPRAGVYSSTRHFLEAVRAVGTVETAAVMQQMKDTPINDLYATNGHIREDGRMVHDFYLVEAKKPSESKYAWDYFKILTIPVEKAFLPLSRSRCPLVKR
jgi:branched-chain amino acid transport system substrate-binding protein